ncbi:MAG: hypothetical protein IPP15_09700 [Saprospiraceae bacterium]|uniref:Uncharacterized protein n=1 Tax=Candidatus Opimibacter skivensis TaxID=2982028 RepID=A0A9D7SV12_9BACT|nr:hypothetical protein [Candidatus Opimibacter skivensis]
MRNTFKSLSHNLKENANRFDPISLETKFKCLKDLSKMILPVNKELITYFETLLFIIAYPSDATQLFLAEKELLRITKILQANRKSQSKLFDNSGMPFTSTITRFSHDGVRWLLAHPHCNVTFNSFESPTLQLNEVLRMTLTSLEKSETTAGLSNQSLMDMLLVPEKQRLRFIINELARLDHLPFIKDHFFDRLELFVRVTPKDKLFSKAYNRLDFPSPYFNLELLKKFEVKEVIIKTLPACAEMLNEESEKVVYVIKNSMAVTGRETDPTTFMEDGSLRLYHLERGISVAIYSMIPSRQLPLESYVGFTAFKNGFPVAYGGAWVFGERANFGINIFESFRNGESAFILAQLLRVYKHVFKLCYFEVEPYQFGLDNPEGIASGAFWFYYRFGFRPLDLTLGQKANEEHEKIKTRKGYRTSHKTLIRFTESSIGLKLGKSVPPGVVDVTARVTRMIQRRYNGDRILAEADCRTKFLVKTKITATHDEYQNQVLTEVALWAEALTIKEAHRLDLLGQMITAKPRDVYAYQDLVINFFKD